MAGNIDGDFAAAVGELVAIKATSAIVVYGLSALGDVYNPSTCNPKFCEAFMLEQQGKDTKHECLKFLPKIFHQAMKRVASLVDLFLNVNRSLTYLPQSTQLHPTQ